jgi:hypothetical protein
MGRGCPDQEIRARALDVAVRLVECVDHSDSLLRDAEQMTIGTAGRLVDWIATGDESPWLWPRDGQSKEATDAAD